MGKQWIVDALGRIGHIGALGWVRRESRARPWLGLGLLVASLGALVVAVRQQPFRPH